MYIEKRPGPARTSVYVILRTSNNGHNVLCGKIIVAHPRQGEGRLHVSLWDFTDHERSVQDGWADGCGYDKTAAALDGMKFDDITLQDHPVNWKIQFHKAGYDVFQLL